MIRAFREVENAFQVLNRRFRDREISRREFIDQLKKLRLRDDQGRFWMIGAQTGRWYYFDGREWVKAEPPAEPAAKLKCYACGLENEPGLTACSRCGESLERTGARCPSCGGQLESPFQECPGCSRGTPVSAYAEEALIEGREKARDVLVLSRIGALSAFVTLGGLGLVIGTVAGAFAGAAGSLSGPAANFFSSLQGTLMGGILFGLIGAVAGFVAAGLLGLLLALVFNLTASVSGGLRVSVRRAPESVDDKKPET